MNRKGFSERLDEALDREGISNAEFVRRLGGRPQLVTGWRARGRIGGPSVKLVKAILTRTNMDWLNDGEGPAESEAFVKARGRESGTASQNAKITPDILSRAEFWVRVEEGAKGEFQPVIRARRILELCRMIQANGNGDLSPQQVLEIMRSTSN